MKILNILLYVLVVVVIVFAVLDITSRAGFSEEDRKAVEFAAKRMDQQINELSFARVRKFNYLNAQINACKNLEGFDAFANKLKLARAVSYEATDNVAWLETQLKDKSGKTTLQDDYIERFQKNLESIAYNFGEIDGTISFAPPVPYKSEVLNKEVSFADLNNSDVAFWKLSKSMVEAYCLEMEETLMGRFISKIECDAPVTNNISVQFASNSKVIAPGEDYTADMLLTGEYYTHKIEVSSEDGDVTYNDGEKKATIVINANVDDSEFDENGEAVKTWTATLKVPSMNGFEIFNIQKEFIVKK